MPGLTFPQNPSDGQTVSFSFQHTGGDANNAVVTKTWSWNESKNSWISNSGGVAGSDGFVLKAGDTMSGDLTTTRAFRASGAVFSSNEFVTKSYVDTELASFNPSGNYVLKTGDTMSGTLTADRAFRASGAVFSSNEFVTKSYVDGLSPSGDFVLKTGDEMSGTLTGTNASFTNSITAPSGFIGTLTANKAFRNSEDGYTSQEFITKKFFTDNEYRTGTIKNFNLYLTYQVAYDSLDYHEAWVNHNQVRYAKSIYDEIGPGVTGFYTINGWSYRSEYHDLTEEEVGFPKPWAVKVKKSFWRSSRNLGGGVLGPPGPRYYPPFGPRPSTDVGNQGPSEIVCDSRNFTTEKDIRIRYIGFKDVVDRGGPGGNASVSNTDINQYVLGGQVGVDFPADGASDGGFARIKLSTFRNGGYPTLGGDTFINEIQIVPG
jgi:hypothetical protein